MTTLNEYLRQYCWQNTFVL